jgi:hypothetical protein
MIFKSAIILTGNGPDKVSIETDLPGACHEEPVLWLDFRAARGTGEEFVKCFFPDLEIKVTDVGP